MSAWRREALRLFPERRQIIQDGRDIFSIYQLFFELLPLVREAHAAQDTDLLSRIYQYAEWCWLQKDRAGQTYNAVAVAFYEHLVDKYETRQAIPQWLKPEIFADVIDLFQPRLPPTEFEEVLSAYDAVHGTDFAVTTPRNYWKLLEVIDAMFVHGRGVLLVLDQLSVAGAPPASFPGTILVVRPDQTWQIYLAHFEVSHFSMADRSGHWAWVAVISLAQLSAIPTGTQVFGSRAAAAKLAGSAS